MPRWLLSMRVDGSERRELAGGLVFHSRWSPSGERIAAVRRREGTGSYEVYTMRADGSDLRMVTNDPDSSAGFPVWSPDGRRIAFWSQRDTRAYTLDPEHAAAEQPRMEALVGSELLHPRDWSADGKLLLGDRADGGVAVLDLTTGVQRPLTETGGNAR